MSPDRGDSPSAGPKGFGPAHIDSKKIVEAVKATRDPPPESQESIDSRRWIVLSFLLIVSLLGLPLWWKTTTVYRSDLPYQSMYHWDAGNACDPVFPLQVVLESPHVPVDQSQKLLNLAQRALDELNAFSAHHLRLVDSTQKSENTVLTVQLLPTDAAASPTAVLQPHATSLDIAFAPSLLPSSSATSSSLASFIADELHNTFLHEQATIAHMIASSPGSHPSSKPLSPEFLALLEDRKTRAMKYSPTYHLTFTLLTPTASPANWEIEAAVHSIINPLVRALSSVSTFTIDTQVQPYAIFSSSVHPVHNEAQSAWFLDQAELGAFINAAEWPLSPSIGEGNTINFLLYVPAPEQTPLYIVPSDATADASSQLHSWLLPQWGSAYILNLPPSALSTGTISAKDLEAPLLSFSTHLLALLGLPEEPHKSLPLRLASLRRTLTLSLLHSSASTLGALARLTQSLPSISIPKPAAASVAHTLSSLDQACAALKIGDFKEALVKAREADIEAERAFFDKSMVGQVYFPDEHKVAVYLPLLGPVAVPLILAFVKEAKAGVACLKALKGV
ncbi:hypothetical protein FH972_021158 [Carpinus fangiana]|uniref:GPI transamidase component PIG-S n=1 Tax=Carpinus fangiana TaxID=176857 RepID=A0A5N6KP49_9ROSI|nr:hypothetical protein FH972_021158 [Carpinus fangiana]